MESVPVYWGNHRKEAVRYWMRSVQDTSAMSSIPVQFFPDVHYEDGVAIRSAATQNNITMLTSLDTVKVLLDVLEEVTIWYIYDRC